MSEKNENKMEKIVSLCKRRGFVYPGSEIYGGLAGTWDYGPLGAELVHNIKESWWNHFVRANDDMYGLQSSVLMPEAVWKASGHLEGFTDPVIVCAKCKRHWRADSLNESQKEEQGKMLCPDINCRHSLGTAEEIKAQEKPFNLMFETKAGAEGTQKAYLRPEIAQGIFVNFKNG